MRLNPSSSIVSCHNDIQATYHSCGDREITTFQSPLNWEEGVVAPPATRKQYPTEPLCLMWALVHMWSILSFACYNLLKQTCRSNSSEVSAGNVQPQKSVLPGSLLYLFVMDFSEVLLLRVGVLRL